MAGPEQREDIVQIGEDEAPVVDPALSLGGELLPAIADIDAGMVEPGQQRGAIGNVAVVVSRLRTDLLVIEPQHLGILAAFQPEQRKMPEDVKPQIVGVRDAAPVAEPGDPLAGPAGHLQHMRDGVAPPGVAGAEGDGAPAGALGFGVEAALFQRKGVAAVDVAGEGVVLAEARREALQGGEHLLLVAQYEAQTVRELEREHVVRVGKQDGFQPFGGAARRVVEPERESLDHHRLAPGDRPQPCGGSRLQEAFAGGPDQLGTGERQQHQPLRRMGEGEVRIGCERAGQMLGRRGGMGHHGLERIVPGQARGVVRYGEAVAGQIVIERL